MGDIVVIVNRITWFWSNYGSIEVVLAVAALLILRRALRRSVASEEG